MIDVRAIVAPPREPEEAPIPGDWAPVEAQIGFELPDDYKELVQIYGTGAFDDFLSVLNPFAENPYLNLLAQAPIRLDAQRQLVELTGRPSPYALHPEPAGIYPWAVTDNGDVLYWLMADHRPMPTIVGHDGRSSKWWNGNYSTAEFLSLILSGRLRINLFPDDFPSDSPVFRPSKVNHRDEPID